METEVTKHDIAKLIMDDDFEHIEIALDEPNIFRALAIERREIRHSNFIGYLLDPNQNHGLKDVFLKKFLRDVFKDSKSKERNIGDADILDLNAAEIRKEWNGIDILILLAKDVIVIENKVDSFDHSNQLNRYKKIVQEAFGTEKVFHYIYLSPAGGSPRDESSRDDYQIYSYRRISVILESILKLYQNIMSEKIYFYLSDYLSTIRRDILMDDPLNVLASKVYAAHKDVFDFVFENRPDPASFLYKFFEDELKRQGYVIASKNRGVIRFTTKELAQKLPKTGVSKWEGKEAFLFQIEYLRADNNAVFNAVISPGNAEIKDEINNALSEDKKHYKKPQGKGWLTVAIKKYPFIALSVMQKEDKKIQQDVKYIIDIIKPIIDDFSSRIESALPKIININIA